MVRTSLPFLGKDSISIRPQQREALLHILSGCETFINLATRFGKRLIFELAQLCMPKRNIPGQFEGGNNRITSFGSLKASSVLSCPEVQVAFFADVGDF